MTLITQYETPAAIRDMPAGSTFYANWHNYLASGIDDTTPGSNGGEFYDASAVDVNVVGQRHLTWMAFPRQVLMDNRDNRVAAYIEAEEPPIPPNTGREVQNEYCEWRVTRNSADKITKIVFVTEAPEYWEHLWDVDQTRVVDLYNSILGTTSVSESDLHDGTGRYLRENRWNRADGIIHMIQNINTLDDALGLSQNSADSGGIRDNFEMGGGPATSVDPRVAFDIGTLVRKGLSVTLQDPIGLYIADWDDTGWTKPDGSPVGDYWCIARGRPGQVLRLEYEVPKCEGFVVGDIRIGGRLIQYGGQIAEHVTVTIAGTAGTRTTPIPKRMLTAESATDEKKIKKEYGRK